ncbi:MAG: hypothetical protein ABSA09_00510 [Desulfobaccales bacterium]|jgi:hypothetical protein
MNPTAETLELLKSAKVLDAAELAKAGIMIAQGLVAYDLEPAAKKIYPLITPLRNTITRIGGGIGTAVHWNSVTGINVARLSPGVSEGHRGGAVSLNTMSNVAAYKVLGHESFVTFEAEEASLPGTDNRALAILTTLQSLMQSEEMVLLGGNGDLALGQTPTPTLADVPTGGVLAPATAYKVVCVALTLEGFLAASVVNGINLSITRTNADGSTDTYGGGAAQASAPATVTTASDGNPTHGLKASVAPVTGAVAYAWFWGPAAGSQTLGAITTINSILILTAAGAGTQTATSLPAADNSVNGLLYDGLITQISTPGSGSYIAFQATGTPGTGTPLTADGAGGVVEINQALEAFWNNYRLSPDIMYVNAQELQNITSKVIAGAGAPLFRFNVDAQTGTVADVTLTAGAVMGFYLNKFTMGGGQLVKVMLHPNLPPGTILFRCERIPYPLTDVTNIIQVKTRREYYQIEWPLRARQWENGVYYSGVLQNYFPPAFGMICNIANG